MMAPQGHGLIVVISSIGGLKYVLNVPYGVGKAAVSIQTHLPIFCHSVPPHLSSLSSSPPGPPFPHNRPSMYLGNYSKEEVASAGRISEMLPSLSSAGPPKSGSLEELDGSLALLPCQVFSCFSVTG